MQVSNHATDRMSERCGLNKKSSERLSKLALENGISHNDTVGSLNRYLTKLFFYNKTANNIRIHGEYVYIFCDDILITVIPLDNKYKKVVRNINTKKGETK
jgi:hypothetical protein